MMNWIISSSVLILVIILLRFCLKGKISLRLQYSLWAIVLIRLLVPVSIGETVLSIENWLDSVSNEKEVQQMMDLTQTPLPSMSYDEAYDIVEEQYAMQGIDIDHIPMAEFSETIEYEILDTMNNGYTPVQILEMIWMMGMVLISLLFIVTNLHFLWKLKRNRVLLGNAGELMNSILGESQLGKRGNSISVYQTNVVETPCLYGLFFPAIYMTKEAVMEKRSLRHVLEHECTHYYHRDYIWSIFRVVCIVLHWYNPLVWCGAFLSRNDAELACDEDTIKRLGETERAAYGRTLIGLTCEKRSAILSTATTMTGTRKGIKERIALIAKKPKMAITTVVVLVILLVVVVVGTFTGTKQDYSSPSMDSDIVNSENSQGNTIYESDDAQVKIEQCIFETTADLNHDGRDDLIKVMTNAKEDRAMLDIDNNGAYIKVFLCNVDGMYDEYPVYISELICSSHGGNGTFALSEKEGKDYLIYSLMDQSQGGHAGYTYSVMYLKDSEMITVQNDLVNFYSSPFNWRFWKEGPRREDVIPKFKESLEPWIEDAIILISFDIISHTYDAQSTFISTKSNVISAESYYDLVWKRSDEESIKEFQAMVGKEEWQKELYWSSSNYFEKKEWIEKQLATDYSKWFKEYDGSKLQRIDNCNYTSNTVGCDVSASCDIVYYRATSGENEQVVLYKMIEKMLRARMTRSDYRTYVITNYTIPKQEIIQISEDMWMIKSLKGYYAFEGSNIGTMQENIDSGTPVTEDGLIPFIMQGDDDTFIHILIEKDGVFRLQRLQEMM